MSEDHARSVRDIPNLRGTEPLTDEPVDESLQVGSSDVAQAMRSEVVQEVVLEVCSVTTHGAGLEPRP